MSFGCPLEVLWKSFGRPLEVLQKSLRGPSELTVASVTDTETNIWTSKIYFNFCMDGCESGGFWIVPISQMRKITLGTFYLGLEHHLQLWSWEHPTKHSDSQIKDIWRADRIFQSRYFIPERRDLIFKILLALRTTLFEQNYATVTIII